jgi:survival-of-motor-neuron-related-splicing factor 30
MSAADDVKELEEQLKDIRDVLVLDPDNEELLALEKELTSLISASTGVSPQSNATAQKPARPTASRKVGDQVLAKWITGDHQYYLAKITSITGSADKPVYTVKFIEYNEVQTVQAHQIKDADAFSHGTGSGKRKVPPPPPPAMPGLASAAGGASIPAPAKKKSKPDTALESSKSTWQSFAQAGPKRKTLTLQSTSALSKVKKGNSMFRTSEDGRVGVMTGPQVSQAQQFHAKRGRHVFERESSKEDRFERRRSRSRSRSRSPRYHDRSRQDHSRSRSRSRDRGYRNHSRRQ